jgi:hypothetical protein
MPVFLTGLPMPSPPADTAVFRPETADELRRCLARLRDAGRELEQTSLEDLLIRLEALGQRWQPGGDCFREAAACLAGTFSPRAVEAALQALAASLDAGVLADAAGRELGRTDLLDAWQVDASGSGLVRGFPLGVVAQVLAGNVFLGGAVALAHTLLTRNAVLLKLSREDSGFTALFARTLREADDGRLGRAVAVCAWDSGRDDLNQVLREEADAVVVWGGAAAVAAYPTGGCRGRVIHYGPRLGIGLLLGGTELETALRALAWDVALWEQRACSSPRLLFVEDARGDGTLPRQAAEGLCRALIEVQALLPGRPLTLDEKAEVLSLRELGAWTQQAEPLVPPRSMSHTVLLAAAPPAAVPVGHRTVVVLPLPSLDRLPALVAPYESGLQTAVLAAPAARWPEAARALVRAGFTQIAAAGSAASRFLGLPHEGEFALRRLVRLVGIDLGAGPLVYPGPLPGEGAAAALAGPPNYLGTEETPTSLKRQRRTQA